MYPNPLKKRLRTGELLIGTSLMEASPYIAGVTIATNPDFLWIETEHVHYGVERLDTIPSQARAQGVAPMIRVAWNDPALIKKVFDVGAVAVMVPQVNTAKEAARAVYYSKYAPEGGRGVAPMWPRIAGEDLIPVIKTANEESVVVLQIESIEAVENLEEIANVPGVDVLFVGPMDLSASLGKITDTRSPEVQGILKEIPQRLKDTGVVAGTVCANAEEAAEKISWGYRYLSVGHLINAGAQVIKAEIEKARAGSKG